MYKVFALLLMSFFGVAFVQAEQVQTSEKASHNAGNHAQNNPALTNAIADLKKLKIAVESANSDINILKMHHLSLHAIRKLIAGVLQVWSSIHLIQEANNAVEYSEALCRTAQILCGIAIVNGAYEFVKGSAELFTGEEHALHLPHVFEVFRKLVATVGQAALGVYSLSRYDNNDNELDNLIIPVAATALMFNSCCDLANARVEWKKSQLKTPAKGLCMIENTQEDDEEEV